MDTKGLLDNLFASGKTFAERGKQVAEEKLNIPDQGPERDAMMSGLGKGAMAAGALAILLGTSGGRKVTGTALKLGSLAALGGLAYKTYQNWQQDEPGNPNASSIPSVAEKRDEPHDRLILSAMIAASKADGHVDENERISLQNYIDRIGESDALSQFVAAELAKPVNPHDLANQITNQEIAAEVYLASLLIIDQSNSMAKAYLEQLAGALALPLDLVQRLNGEIEPVG